MSFCNVCGEAVVREGPIMSTLALSKSGISGLAEFLKNHFVKTTGSSDLGNYPAFEIDAKSLTDVERVLSFALRHGLDIRSRPTTHGLVVTSFRIYFCQATTRPEASTVSAGDRIPFSN
jgi:hypothetical protein